MNGGITLEHYLAQWAAQDDTRRAEVAATLFAIAGACTRIAEIVSAGALGGRVHAPKAPNVPLALSRPAIEGLFSGTGDSATSLGATIGDHGAGDAQKVLDVMANAILFSALREAPVAALVSEEIDSAVPLNATGSLLVAIDPLDGSSNIDANVSVGTIFSILPAPGNGAPIDATAFFQPGERQLAAGYVIYGPQTALALTTGTGTHVFTLDRQTRQFHLTVERVRVPAKTREFAINASNHRHWDEPIRIYIDDCLKGCEGPRGEDFNMRWIASMVAEAHRVLARGGVYMYPGDLRNGYEHGRLRLIYEASPVAWLMEQAGAAASTGMARILEITPQALHQRVPLIFGSRDEVDRLDRYHRDPYPLGERSPLFGRRGLFRS
jgi:fructose-1,6-bisphosphatase I